MSGIIFMIYIPTEEQENRLSKRNKKTVTIDEFGDSSRIRKHKMCSNFQDLKEHGVSKQSLDKAIDPSENKTEHKTMYRILHDILEQLNIRNSTWCKGFDDNYVQITFPYDSRDGCDEILDVLKENNIGKLFHSIVSVIPCTIHSNQKYEEKGSKCYEENDNDEPHEKHTAWNRFVSSVRARLTVAQVVENVKSHATLTFDFVCLIVISTVLCAIGLVENSNVYLLSSMLISPMMGPVMAGTFGRVIQDKLLQKIGVQNELIGLGIATLVGFCYGSVICIVTDKYGVHEWPTYEMISRGELRTLWVGCLIALLSGAAVALGILSDNIASLVGVAISTSLMPPAVNAGLLWSLASVYYVKGNETTRYNSLLHTEYYSQNRALELLTLGAVSICLTFVNIVCIYVSGILVFKIKEVAPIASRDQMRRQFWTNDIKIARDYNKIFKNDESNILYGRLSNEYESYHRRLNNPYDCYTNHLHHSTDLSKENTKITVTRSEYTWSPCMNVAKRPSVDELCKLYSNMFKEKSQNVPLNLTYNMPVPPPRATRRLSQIFIPNDSGNVDKSLDTIEEISSDKERILITPDKSMASGCSENCSKIKPKFVVTRCEPDVLQPQ